jgi:hypothetical protein
MAEETQNQNQVATFDKQLAMAKSVKDLFELPDVKTRAIKGYMATTGNKDGEHRFQQERGAYLEICQQKPDLKSAPMWLHFKVINKVMNNGWSLRDNRLYLQVVKSGDKVVDIKLDPSPAVRREMMERMDTIKEVPEAQVVVKGDIFIEDKLNHKILKHEATEKSLQPDKLENILYAYQRIIYKDNSVKDVVVPHYDLVIAKSKSKIKGDDAGVWQWVAEACKKVATNRAYRLYHKYTGKAVILDEDEDDNTVESDHEEIPNDPEVETAGNYAEEVVDQETGEITEGQMTIADTQQPNVEKKKEKKQKDLLND